MEDWPDRSDRPYLERPASSPMWVWWIALLIVLLIGAAAAYFYHWRDSPRMPEGWWSPAAAPAPAPATHAAAVPQPEPAPAAAIRHPLDPGDRKEALPALDNSDSMMREALTGLLGAKAFGELVYPAQLVRRIVATVDNLPRSTAPRRVMALQPVPGVFPVIRKGDEGFISAANPARYAPYVRVLESLDSRALVRRYVASYPLFQRAYEELGFPDRYFNDRLLEAIDDLLDAPDVAAPVALVQPKVLYEFADPDLEMRSAGQKIMIRMGSENAAKVKAKLRDIRRELLAAAAAAR